jgi:hypothetical protein
MALFGLIIQCLPVTVLLSKRCRSFGPLSLRAAFVIWYLGCPNAREIHIVATNTQWHLGVVAGLLSFADPPEGWTGRFFDIFVFSVLGLSAPFCIVLAPLTMIYFLFRRRQWTLVQALILFASAFVQIMMLHKDAHRVVGPLGASVSLFLRIFGVNIIGAGIFGGFAIERLLPLGVAVLASIGGATLYIYVLRFAGLEQKLFTIFCLGIFLGSLRSPFAGSVLPAWEVLTNIPSCRYWFFPMLAFLWGVIWCARFAQHTFVKRLAAYTLMFSTIGFLAQWEYKAYPNYNFPAADQRFRKASAGSPVTIPIIPEGWSMTIDKKGPSGSDR